MPSDRQAWSSPVGLSEINLSLWPPGVAGEMLGDWISCTGAIELAQERESQCIPGVIYLCDAGLLFIRRNLDESYYLHAFSDVVQRFKRVEANFLIIFTNVYINASY